MYMPMEFFSEATSTGVRLSPRRRSLLKRALKTRTAVQIQPIWPPQTRIARRHPRMVGAVELGGIRTAVAVLCSRTMSRLELLHIHRPEVRSFDEKQIALLDQLRRSGRYCNRERAIAQRIAAALYQPTSPNGTSPDLTGSVLEQPARPTSEGFFRVIGVAVLPAIWILPVFQAMLENATRICDYVGVVFRL